LRTDRDLTQAVEDRRVLQFQVTGDDGDPRLGGNFIPYFVQYGEK